MSGSEARSQKRDKRSNLSFKDGGSILLVRSSESQSTSNSVSGIEHESEPQIAQVDVTKRSEWSSSRSLLYLGLLAFRLANALLVQTFFQPDEFFQALEPAWQLAFGSQSGAWITWEWRSHLRSSAHPVIFAIAYRAAAGVSQSLGLDDQTQAQILIATPKVLQALVAACIDFSIWSIGERIQGDDFVLARTSLLLSILSPWQWFCSVRTFSNTFETALTAGALSFWPYQWMISDSKDPGKRSRGFARMHVKRDLRIALLLAAFATILRPTGIVTWLPIAVLFLLRNPSGRQWLLVRTAIVCGLIALGCNLLLDRAFYGKWTVPAWHFYQINARERIADFYGVNRLDYYLTEGLPLLLCIAPLLIIIRRLATLISGSAARLQPPKNVINDAAVQTFGLSIISTILSFTAVAHKEARFIYPLLPMLLPLSANSLPQFTSRTTKRFFWKAFSALLMILQIVLAWYISRLHQSGVIGVMDYLRDQRQLLATRHNASNMSVGFLMPCHSTPWRSHLVHGDVQAWALTCEPPLGVPFEYRSSYRDEADQFYDNPHAWLNTHMVATSAKNTTINSRHWSDYLVFFEQLEPVMSSYAARYGYAECWRIFNSHWHDDWRRQGDVIVYCRHQSETMRPQNSG